MLRNVQASLCSLLLVAGKILCGERGFWTFFWDVRARLYLFVLSDRGHVTQVGIVTSSVYSNWWSPRNIYDPSSVNEIVVDGTPAHGPQRWEWDRAFPWVCNYCRVCSKKRLVSRQFGPSVTCNSHAPCVRKHSVHRVCVVSTSFQTLNLRKCEVVAGVAVNKVKSVVSPVYRCRESEDALLLVQNSLRTLFTPR